MSDIIKALRKQNISNAVIAQDTGMSKDDLKKFKKQYAALKRCLRLVQKRRDKRMGRILDVQ